MNVRQMGGIGTAWLDVYQLNFDNPAALSHLQATGFDLGLDFKNSVIEEGANRSNQWSGNLSYLALGFTLRNPLNALYTREQYKFNYGMGFALMPNSQVSYDITRQDALSNGDLYTRNFSGEGGTYKAIWSNAIKYGDFSAGVSLGWLFGQVDYTRSVDFTSEQASFDNSFRSQYTMRGFYSKIGLIYLGVLNKDEVNDNIGRDAPKSIAVGVSYKPSLGFDTKAEVLNINFVPISLTSALRDTIFYSGEQLGTGSLPAELAFGVTYTHGYDWALGVDYRLINWSDYRNDANPETLSNTSRFAIGGFYRPNYASLNSIFSRSSYNFGVYIEEDPRQINNEKINTFGVTFGIGMPLAWQRKFSNLNIGMDIGKRSLGDLLNENYARITFGFTFNEGDWFRKFYLD